MSISPVGWQEVRIIGEKDDDDDDHNDNDNEEGPYCVRSALWFVSVRESFMHTA